MSAPLLDVEVYADQEEDVQALFAELAEDEESDELPPIIQDEVPEWDTWGRGGVTVPLLSQLSKAKNGLEDAQIAYCGAVAAHAEVKRVLELAAKYAALDEAEDALTEARCALEVARLEWDLTRYQVRVLEVAVPVEVAA